MNFGFSDETIKELIAYALKGGTGWHITRNAMYKALASQFETIDGPDKRCLSISDSEFFGRILGLKQCRFTPANYPQHNIMDLRFNEGEFDFCISDQVFEHIEGDPFVAFKESVRVVKRGGYVCHTTCFLNEVHGVPKDFWRYTTTALELLARSAGCDEIKAGGWGNREAWALMGAGFRTAKIPEDTDNPLYKLATRNEPAWPIVTWVTARKA